jgi:serine/threonine protein kinase
MGVPVDEGDYHSFLISLESLVHRVHACGVVHVDLYPSNIMWAKTGGVVTVKIIDWDAATFVGQTFTSTMAARIKSEAEFVYSDAGAASIKNDAWDVYLLGDLSAAERASLAAPMDAPSVAAAFRCIIKERTWRRGSLEALHGAFLEWFTGFETRAAAAAAAVPAAAAAAVAAAAAAAAAAASARRAARTGAARRRRRPPWAAGT